MGRAATNIIDGDYFQEYTGFCTQIVRAARILRRCHNAINLPGRRSELPAFLLSLEKDIFDELMKLVREKRKIRTLHEYFLDEASRQRITGVPELMDDFTRALEAAPGKQEALDTVAKTLNTSQRVDDILAALNQGFVLLGQDPWPVPTVTG